MKQKLNILLGGYIICGPLGGMVWHHLQYVLGLKKLGHNVLFIEDSHDYPACYDPEIDSMTTDSGYGLQFINRIFSEFELGTNWAYFDSHKNKWHGKSFHEATDFINHADVFINLSGIYPWREFLSKIPVRIFLDTDPAFTQITLLQEKGKKHVAELHTDFFTFAENINNENCSIPQDGFKWIPTRQPIVLDAWKATRGNTRERWTTVMQWDSYKTRTYQNRTYGMKSMSFNDFLSLPQKVNESLELALGNASALKTDLKDFGWIISNPLEIAKSHHNYQKYIQSSKGEWSVAKHGYVVTKSGWFSERSACYLASGRPVLVQDTAFSQIIETGKGLFSFSTPEESLDIFEKINRDYDTECKNARNIAEQYFDSGFVLLNLLKNIN